MKTSKHFISLGLLTMCLLNSCTYSLLVGGTHYNAHVHVEDNPNATIYYNGKKIGKGQASLKIARRKANKVVYKIVEEGCREEEHSYTSRAPRVSAVITTVFESTSLLFLGTGVNLLTGAYWQPYTKHHEITKFDYNNFDYSLQYTGCEPTNKNQELNNEKEIPKISAEELRNRARRDSINEIDLVNILYQQEGEKESVYYNKFNELIVREDIHEVRLISLKYSSGKLKQVGLRISGKYGIQEDYFHKIGTWKYYYKNGGVKKIINYNLKEQRNGLYIEYDEQGNEIIRKVYKDGKLISQVL